MTNRIVQVLSLAFLVLAAAVPARAQGGRSRRRHGAEFL